MACDHAGNLSKLDGWETIWCPICDKGKFLVDALNANETEASMIGKTANTESGQNAGVVMVAEQPKTTAHIKTGLSSILEKNKRERATKNCKCEHNPDKTCTGDKLCERCSECVPF